MAQVLVDQFGDFGHFELSAFSDQLLAFGFRFSVGRASAPAINQTLKYEMKYQWHRLPAGAHRPEACATFLFFSRSQALA
jgi:hypothetical protein